MKHFRVYKMLASIVGLSCAAVGAQAATITFDLQGKDGSYYSLPSSFSLTEGGGNRDV